MAAAAAKTAKSPDLCPETFGHGREEEERREERGSALREQIIRSKMCKYCSREAEGRERKGEGVTEGRKGTIHLNIPWYGLYLCCPL